MEGKHINIKKGNIPRRYVLGPHHPLITLKKTLMVMHRGPTIFFGLKY